MTNPLLLLQSMKIHLRTLTTLACQFVLLALFMASSTWSQPMEQACNNDPDLQRTRYKTETVAGIDIFFREAGNPSCPTILLLHGFSSSSHMFRELLPQLSQHFYLLAPDYPGFGHSESPSASEFSADFASLSSLIAQFIIQKNLPPFILYMQDFGGPVGFRIAEQHPQWIKGLIVQNANAYIEGLVFPAEPRKKTTRKTSELVVNSAYIKHLYQYGTRNPDNLNPDSWHIDIAVLNNPEAKRIQSSLIDDYANNIERYSLWQTFLRQQQPNTLIAWGQNDQAFSPAGAKAFLQDLPDAQLYLYDTGHFALEEDLLPIAHNIRRLFSKQ